MKRILILIKLLFLALLVSGQVTVTLPDSSWNRSELEENIFIAGGMLIDSNLVVNQNLQADSVKFDYINLTTLTATRLMASDANKNVVSSDLNSWVAGTANEVDITDDGDGTITIGQPNDVTIGNNLIVTTNTDLGGTVTLSKGSQNYIFTDRSALLTLQSQTSGSQFSLELYSKDSDGTDNTSVVVYSKGDPTDVSNREKFEFKYNNSRQFEVVSEAQGTGTLLPIVLMTEGNTDQIKAEVAGSVLIGAGDLRLEGGFDLWIEDATGDDSIRIFDDGSNANILSDNPIKLSSYTRHHDINAGAAVLGPTGPSPTTVGTFRGLGFDADAEVANFVFEVPVDWDGVSDITVVIHWYPTSGDAIANGETVKWDINYRSIALGEAVDNGTVVTITATFTGGASETDKEHYETSITIDFDNANQPLAVGDDIGFQFDRDVSGDTYSGAGIVFKLDLVFSSNALPRD